MMILGFLHYVTPMLMCIVGLCLFTVRREHCQKKFTFCIIVTIVFEYLIYYSIFTGDAEIQGIPTSKILIILMINILIFWGGLYVYGGWSRIGIYLLTTDMFLGIGQRIYWSAWEKLTHQSADASVIYFKDDLAFDLSDLLKFLPDFLLLTPFLIGGYKLRGRTLRPEWLFKTIVIIYLVLGASPLSARPGLDGGLGKKPFIIIFVWLVLFFLVVMTIHITAIRENRRILYLRKQVVAEQSRLLMIQKEKVRRLRHDVKKHLSNLEYILEKEPGLRSDPSVLHYQQKLQLNEEWMKGVFYCDSTAVNLCFEQIKRYCDDKGIVLDIALKRVDFSGWTQEDQFTFGTLLFNLLQLYGDSQSITAIRYTGDCMLGQNILRISMTPGTDNSQNQNKIEDRTEYREKGRTKGGTKEMRLISNMEKDIRLLISKFGGRLEHIDDGAEVSYVLNWKDEIGK